MPIMAKKSEASFELTPAGTHLARCYQVIDLGTQKVMWQGTEKKQHKVYIGFELPDELMADGRPFATGQRYTLSLSEKATLRGVLESWRGQSFSEEEINGFDIEKLLGVACMVNIVHNKTGDKTYANIAGIVKLPKNTQCQPAINPPVKFSLDTYTEAAFIVLPEWLRKVIAQSDEYMMIVGKDVPTATQASPPDFDEFDKTPF